MRRNLAVISVLTVAFLAPARSEAQAVASNFEEVRFRLATGDTVYVSRNNGQEQEARVLGVSPSSLAVSIGGIRRDLSEREVTRIRQRLPDPLWNGAVIGAAGGLGIGVTYLLTGVIESCDTACGAIEVALYGGLGAVIGVGVDALIKGRKTIYATGREPSTNVVVRPILRSNDKGLSVSVQF